jgi:hypothetical protein
MASKKTTTKKASTKKDEKGEKGPSPALLRYALTFARTTLGEGGDHVTVTEVDGLVKFACRGVPYATLSVEGNDVVVTLRKPKADGDLRDKLALYQEAPTAGWLQWRTAVGRDPRPWLEAGIGTMNGKARFEIIQGGAA